MRHEGFFIGLSGVVTGVVIEKPDGEKKSRKVVL
jgi:hypothetical protein